MTRRFLVGLSALWVFSVVLQNLEAYERAPSEVVRALGTNRGKLISSGLVFIDGQYLKPPYRVTRAGNQILINDRPVSGQLVAWEKLLETQPPSNLKVTEVEEAVTPPAEPETKPAPAEDGVDPAAPKDGGNAAPEEDDGSARLTVRIVETRYAADADDLEDFKPGETPEKMKLTDIPADSDEDKKRQKRAEEEKQKEAEEGEEEEAKGKGEGEGEGEGEQGTESTSVDANGDDIDPASPEGEAAAKKAAAKAPAPVAKKTRKVTTLAGKFEMNFQAQKLLKPVDDRKAQMEKVLRRGGFLFIGTGPKTYLKGGMSDAIWTKELLKKLPELMSRAKSAESFCDDVRSSGLFSYLNMQIANDLYRHKRAYYELMQRRKALSDEEKLHNLGR